MSIGNLKEKTNQFVLNVKRRIGKRGDILSEGQRIYLTIAIALALSWIGVFFIITGFLGVWK